MGFFTSVDFMTIEEFYSFGIHFLVTADVKTIEGFQDAVLFMRDKQKEVDMVNKAISDLEARGYSVIYKPKPLTEK